MWPAPASEQPAEGYLQKRVLRARRPSVQPRSSGAGEQAAEPRPAEIPAGPTAEEAAAAADAIINKPEYATADASALRIQKPVNNNQMEGTGGKLLPTRLLKKLGMQQSNFMVYEQIGRDGRVHRNFVTVHEDGTQGFAGERESGTANTTSLAQVRLKSSRPRARERPQAQSQVGEPAKRLSKVHSKILQDLHKSRQPEAKRASAQQKALATQPCEGPPEATIADSIAVAKKQESKR